MQAPDRVLWSQVIISVRICHAYGQSKRRQGGLFRLGRGSDQGRVRDNNPPWQACRRAGFCRSGRHRAQGARKEASGPRRLSPDLSRRRIRAQPVAFAGCGTLSGFLLDTNVISMLSPSAPDVPAPFLGWLERMDGEGRIFLSAVTVHEIEKGITLL